jgi:hypothetical protein
MAQSFNFSMLRFYDVVLGIKINIRRFFIAPSRKANNEVSIGANLCCTSLMSFVSHEVFFFAPNDEHETTTSQVF